MVFDDDRSNKITWWYLSECALLMQDPMHNGFIRNVNGHCYKHQSNYWLLFPLKASFFTCCIDPVWLSSCGSSSPGQLHCWASKTNAGESKYYNNPSANGFFQQKVPCTAAASRTWTYIAVRIDTSGRSTFIPRLVLHILFSFTLWSDTLSYIVTDAHPLTPPSTLADQSASTSRRSAAATKHCDGISTIRFWQPKIPCATAPLRTWTCILSRINTNGRSTFWPRYSKAIEWYFTIWFILSCNLIYFQVFLLNTFPMTPSTQTNHNQDNGTFEASLFFFIHN